MSDTLDVTFTVYDALVDGNALWTETHSITFDDGYYSVELGEATALDPTVIDGSTRYMAMTIEGDDQLSPRSSVGSVPIAGGTLIDFDADWSPVKAPFGASIPMTVTQRISGLPAGTYNVGMCYRTNAGQSVNWNDNQWVTNRVLVLL